MKSPAEQTTGLLAALAAFSLWGFLPLYFHAIGAQVSVWEVVSHRVLWAAVVLGGFALLSGRGGRVLAVVRQPRMLLALAASAACIALNWLTFIWAVTHDHVLDSSLGYYITPLINVFMGRVFLAERLRPLQAVAVALAGVGVLIMVGAYGAVPWVALTLALAFAFYGLIRKQVPVDSPTGLLIETLLLLPFALSMLGWLFVHHEAVFLHTGLHLDLLLIGAGLVTVVPLLLFAAGARRLRLGTIGLLQYIAPTVQFFTGVYLFGEPFTRIDAITFTFIWVSLAIFSYDTLRQRARSADAAVATQKS